MTTVRTIKLKRNPTGSSEPMSLNVPTPEASAATPAEEGATQATTATPSPAPAAASAPAPAMAGAISAKSYLPYAIAAGVVVAFFLIIMGLQYSEMSLYQADPSVWVRK
jgi:hypothetical protein